MSDFVPETEEIEGGPVEVDVARTPSILPITRPPQQGHPVTDQSTPTITVSGNVASSFSGFSRRFLNNKWYGKYGDDGELLEHVKEDWVPVPADEVEFLSQLWFEQEEQEKIVS